MRIKFYRETSTLVIASSIKKEDLDFALKYSPDILTVKDVENNEVFKVEFVENKSNISPFGVTFGRMDSNGNMLMVKQITCSEEEILEEIYDYVNPVISYLNILEESFTNEIRRLREQKDEFMNSVELI